jgi:hypothetical protein
VLSDRAPRRLDDKLEGDDGDHEAFARSSKIFGSKRRVSIADSDCNQFVTPTATAISS